MTTEARTAEEVIEAAHNIGQQGRRTTRRKRAGAGVAAAAVAVTALVTVGVIRRGNECVDTGRHDTVGATYFLEGMARNLVPNGNPRPIEDCTREKGGVDSGKLVEGQRVELFAPRKMLSSLGPQRPGQ